MWTCDDLKNKARLSLTGKYWWAVLWTLVYSVLSGMASSVVSLVSSCLFQIMGLSSTVFLGSNLYRESSEGLSAPAMPHSVYPSIAFFIFLFIVSMLIIYAMAFALVIFVISPLYLGYQKWYFGIREGEDGKHIDSLFTAFRKNTYGRMVRGMAWKTLWSVLWAMAGALPILICAAFGAVFFIGKIPFFERDVFELSGADTLFLIILACVYAAGTILYVLVMINRYYAYQFVPFLLLDEPSQGFRETLKKSIAMSKGQKLHMFGLDLSFIGWWLLVILTCGYGAIFLTPYVTAARTELYFARKTEYENGLNTK